jgi:hypothetical protein
LDLVPFLTIDLIFLKSLLKGDITCDR